MNNREIFTQQREIYSIDFTIAPQEIKDFKFGEPITRDNFSHFLIDGFTRSRGNASSHAYSWNWIRRHQGINIPQMMEQFLETGGINNLTEEERNKLENSYQNIKKHKDMPVEKPFMEAFNQELQGVSLISLKQGGQKLVSINGRKGFIKAMEERILSLDAPDFLRWQQEESKSQTLFVDMSIMFSDNEEEYELPY